MLWPSFLRKEWLVGRQLLPEILGQLAPVGAIADFEPIFARGAPQP